MPELLKCRYCQSIVPDKDSVCPSCGYDPKTDIIIKSPQNPAAKAGTGKRPTGEKPKSRVPVGLLFVLLAAGAAFLLRFFGIDIISPVVAPVKAFWNKANRKQGVRMPLIQPRIGPEKNYPDFLVEGICFYPEGKSYVVANGSVLREGDRLGRITVQKINQDTVEVNVNSATIPLKVSDHIPFP